MVKNEISVEVGLFLVQIAERVSFGEAIKNIRLKKKIENPIKVKSNFLDLNYHQWQIKFNDKVIFKGELSILREEAERLMINTIQREISPSLINIFHQD